MAQSAALNPGQDGAEKRMRFDFLENSSRYNIFILVLTVLSLTLLVIQIIIPKDTPAWGLANFYDNMTCIVFLIDFVLHLIQEPVKRDYLIGKRGILDLLGSIPSFGFFSYTALLRIFRISRLFRLRRLLEPANRKLLKEELLHNRGEYALLFTLLAVLVVLTMASIFVLVFESQSPDANITTGGDAMWWSVVTITTVGYGDKFPVTLGGRIVATFVMFSGVGIIGALASILASILVPQPNSDDSDAAPDPALEAMTQELTSVKDQLAALRELIEKQVPPTTTG